MNVPDLVRKNPLYQAFFAVGSLSILLIASALIRFRSVSDRFDEQLRESNILSSYMIIEIALLLITIAGIIFIWFVLLQGRLAGFIFFNFGRGNTTDSESDSLFFEADSFEASSLSASAEAAEAAQTSTHLSHASAPQNQLFVKCLEVGNSILKIHNLNDLLSSTVEIVQTKFDVYHAQVYLAEASAKTLTLRAGSGRLGAELLRRGHRLAIGAGSINGTAAQRKETILVNDTTKSDLYYANPLLSRTRSEISVPVMVDNELYGVLNLQSEQQNGISPGLKSVIEAVASQLAIAIKNALRFETLEEEQKIITDQAARLTQSGWENWLKTIDSEEALTYYHRQSGDEDVSPEDEEQNMFMASSIVVSGSEIGNIHIETDSNRHWGIEDIDLVRAVANQLGQRIENLRLLNESDRFRQEAENALKQLTRQNWGEFTDSLSQNGYRSDGNSLEEVDEMTLEEAEAVKAQLDLTIRGEKVGGIQLMDDEVDTEDRAMLEAISESLSAHIENLRLTEQTRRQVFELSLLNRINTAMSADVNLYTLIEIVGNELQEGFGASSTFISIYNRESNMMEYPYFVIDSKDGLQRIQEEPRIRGTGFSSQVIQSAKPLLISRNPEEMIRAGALVVDMSEMPHSYLGVPIIFGDEVLGVLSLQNRPDRRLFTERDQDVVVSIANSMALTLQNSDLFIKTQNALKNSERRQQELMAINSVVATTTTAVTVNEAIDRMAQKLMDLTNSHSVCTAMLNQNSKHQLEIISERIKGTETSDQVGNILNLNQNDEIKMVIDTQKIFISDTEKDDLNQSRRVILPIIGQSGAIGTVRLEKSNDMSGFTEDQVNLAETIVYQVSTVLENKQLLSDTRSRALREQKVRAITDRIRRGGDQREILRIAKEELSNLVGAKQARSWIGPSNTIIDNVRPDDESDSSQNKNGDA